MDQVCEPLSRPAGILRPYFSPGLIRAGATHDLDRTRQRGAVEFQEPAECGSRPAAQFEPVGEDNAVVIAAGGHRMDHPIVAAGGQAFDPVAGSRWPVAEPSAGASQLSDTEFLLTSVTVSSVCGLGWLVRQFTIVGR